MAEGPEENSLCDKVVLLLTSGTALGRVEQFCAAQGASDQLTKKVIKSARLKVTLAADYSREEQVGTAISQLNDLYAKSIIAKDPRTALQARRELNRLMGLYGDSPGETPTGQNVEELVQTIETIKGYLIPLGLADESYPIQEQVRIAADIIRQKNLHKT